jgi:hypothetical protein
LALALGQSPHLPQKDVRVWQKVRGETPAGDINVGCYRHDAGVVMNHYNQETGKLERHEIEDWKVECTVKVGGVVIWHGEDIMSHHPIELKDVQAEICVFTTVTGYQMGLEELERRKAAQKPKGK